MDKFFPIHCTVCGVTVSYTADKPFSNNSEKLFCPACANAILLLHNDFSKLNWHFYGEEDSLEVSQRPHKTQEAIYSYINGSDLHRLLHQED